MKSAVPYVASAINHKGAINGADAESLEQAIIKAPRILRSRDRAVTVEDFEVLAQISGQGSIARVRCLSAEFNRQAGTVRLLIVPNFNTDAILQGQGLSPDKFELSSALKEQVLRYLDERRLLGVQVQLQQPEYMGVCVQTEIGLEPAYDNPFAREEILSNIRVSLYKFLNPLTGGKDITQPADAFFPGYNNIDLRYRRQAQARPQAIVRMAQVNHGDSECARNFFNLTYFLQSIEPLYPYLRGLDEPGQVSFADKNIQEYDLLYLTGRQELSINSVEFKSLKKYLNTGGILLVDAPADAEALIQSTHALAEKLETPLKHDRELRRDHSLRTRPFLFAALPIVNQRAIEIFAGGGIILIVGDLASAWGLDKELKMPRLAIRTAQEFGINIIFYAWKHRHLIGLQQEDNSGKW